MWSSSLFKYICFLKFRCKWVTDILVRSYVGSKFKILSVCCFQIEECSRYWALSMSWRILKILPEKAMAPHSGTLAWKSHGQRSLVGCSPWGREELDTTERLHFHFHALEKEMATHSSVLAWRIPGTEEPGGLLSMRSHRVGHDWRDLAAAAAAAGS